MYLFSSAGTLLLSEMKSLDGARVSYSGGDALRACNAAFLLCRPIPLWLSQSKQVPGDIHAESQPLMLGRAMVAGWLTAGGAMEANSTLQESCSSWGFFSA